MINIFYNSVLNIRNSINLLKKKITGIYLVSEPIASKNQYLKIFKKAKLNKNLEIRGLEKEFGFSIKKKWLDNLALKTQIVKKKSTIDYQHGRLLYSMVRRELKKFTKNDNYRILEVGTARGFSSIVMSKAISDSNKKGNIITIDIIPNKKKFTGILLTI